MLNNFGASSFLLLHLALPSLPLRFCLSLTWLSSQHTRFEQMMGLCLYIHIHMCIYIHMYIWGVGLRRSLPTSAILLLYENWTRTFRAEREARRGEGLSKCKFGCVCLVPTYLCLPHGADQENLIFDLEDYPYVQSQPSFSTQHGEPEEASGAWFCACTAQDVTLHFLCRSKASLVRKSSKCFEERAQKEQWWVTGLQGPLCSSGLWGF